MASSRGLHALDDRVHALESPWAKQARVMVLAIASIYVKTKHNVCVLHVEGHHAVAGVADWNPRCTWLRNRVILGLVYLGGFFGGQVGLLLIPLLCETDKA